MASMCVNDVGAENGAENGEETVKKTEKKNDTENDTEKIIILAINSNPYISQEALTELCNKLRITFLELL